MRDTELLELRAIASGHVQNVGFRAITQRFAQKLKLTGFVRNLDDGSVEICAQGLKSGLEQLLADLERAFPGESIHFNFLPIQNFYTEFTIAL